MLKRVPHAARGLHRHDASWAPRTSVPDPTASTVFDDNRQQPVQNCIRVVVSEWSLTLDDGSRCRFCRRDRGHGLNKLCHGAGWTYSATAGTVWISRNSPMVSPVCTCEPTVFSRTWWISGKSTPLSPVCHCGLAAVFPATCTCARATYSTTGAGWTHSTTTGWASKPGASQTWLVRIMLEGPLLTELSTPAGFQRSRRLSPRPAIVGSHPFSQRPASIHGSQGFSPRYAYWMHTGISNILQHLLDSWKSDDFLHVYCKPNARQRKQVPHLHTRPRPQAPRRHSPTIKRTSKAGSAKLSGVCVAWSNNQHDPLSPRLRQPNQERTTKQQVRLRLRTKT